MLLQILLGHLFCILYIFQDGRHIEFQYGRHPKCKKSTIFTTFSNILSVNIVFKRKKL
jgi:hypothetical protein